MNGLIISSFLLGRINMEEPWLNASWGTVLTPNQFSVHHHSCVRYLKQINWPYFKYANKHKHLT